MFSALEKLNFGLSFFTTKHKAFMNKEMVEFCYFIALIKFAHTLKLFVRAEYISQAIHISTPKKGGQFPINESEGRRIFYIIIIYNKRLRGLYCGT
jgi:hypothetical protein